MSDRLLTTRQIADYLGFSPETILRKWRTGELPGYRLGSNVLRFSEPTIEAYLADRLVSSGSEPHTARHE